MSPQIERRLETDEDWQTCPLEHLEDYFEEVLDEHGVEHHHVVVTPYTEEEIAEERKREEEEARDPRLVDG